MKFGKDYKFDGFSRFFHSTLNFLFSVLLTFCYLDFVDFFLKKNLEKKRLNLHTYVHHNGKREDEWNENANASTVLKIGPWIYPFFGEAQNPLQVAVQHPN